jgi:hypothetical protein
MTDASQCDDPALFQLVGALHKRRTLVRDFITDFRHLRPDLFMKRAA